MGFITNPHCYKGSGWLLWFARGWLNFCLEYSNASIRWTASQEAFKPSDFIIDVYHDDVIKWKHFPRYWPFVRGIHRSPVNSQHKGQRRFDVFFYLRLNKRSSKQSWGWWFETLSSPLWRHSNNYHNHSTSSRTVIMRHPFKWNNINF